MSEEKKVEKVLIKFIKSYSPYNAGEMAGFKHDKAAAYVEGGAAIYCDEDGIEIMEEEPKEKIVLKTDNKNLKSKFKKLFGNQDDQESDK